MKKILLIIIIALCLLGLECKSILAIENVNDDTMEKIEVGVESKFEDVSIFSWYAQSVNFVTEKGIMSGTSENEFSPDKPITRAMFTTILYRLAGEPEVDNTIVFDDIDNEKYYYNAVKWAYTCGIIDGYSDYKFEPDAELNREQMVSILYRYARFFEYGTDIYDEKKISKFSDFDNISEFAVTPIEWAYENALVHGKNDNRFEPQGCVTRAEMAIILEQFLTGYLLS